MGVAVMAPCMSNLSPTEQQHSIRNALQPIKATPIVLHDAMDPPEAYAVVLRNVVAHMEANEHGAAQRSDPESVHQMRVALRRLRSAIAIFREHRNNDALVPDIRWLAGVLGTVRNWDVFLAETLPLLREWQTQTQNIDQLRVRSETMRDAASGHVKSALASARYDRLKQALRSSANEPWSSSHDDLRKFATATLQRRYEKACKRAHGLHTQSWIELHELRIAVKKLRYPVEFFSALFKAPHVRVLRGRLTELQDVLGAMNDASTAQQLIRVLSAPPSDGALVEHIDSWAGDKIRTLHAVLSTAWTIFRRTSVFW